MQEIKVYVVDRGRKNLSLRYIDPVSGRWVEKSAKTSDPDNALKAAGKWEDELRDGRYKPKSKTTWAEFRERYETEAVAEMKDTSDLKVSGVFDAVEHLATRFARVTRGPDWRTENSLAGRKGHVPERRQDDCENHPPIEFDDPRSSCRSQSGAELGEG